MTPTFGTCKRHQKRQMMRKAKLWFFACILQSSENSVLFPLTSRKQKRIRRTKPITKRGNVHCDWFILPRLLPTPTIWFSLDQKRNVSDGVVSGVGRKWKRSDSSNSDSVALMTPPTTPTPTPSLEKTIRINGVSRVEFRENIRAFFRHGQCKVSVIKRYPC